MTTKKENWIEPLFEPKTLLLIFDVIIVLLLVQETVLTTVYVPFTVAGVKEFFGASPEVLANFLQFYRLLVLFQWGILLIVVTINALYMGLHYRRQRETEVVSETTSAESKLPTEGKAK